MTRTIAASLLGVAILATTALAQNGVPYGKSVQIEFTERHPTGHANADSSRTSGYYTAVVVPVEQGDKFRIEMSPVGGVEMKLHAQVEQVNGNRTVPHESSEFTKNGIDWTTEKGIPGRRAKITLWSWNAGKVNVRISKIGINDPAPGTADAKDTVIEQLRTENAELRKQLDAQKKQLDEILILLKKEKK